VEPHALYGFEDVLRGRRGASRAQCVNRGWGGEEALHGGVAVGVGRGDAYGHFEDGGGAGAEEGGAADFADEGGHVAGVVEAEGLGVQAVFVAEGEVVEEVFDGDDAAVGEAGGDAVADALDEFYGRGELERHGLDGSSGSCAGECVRGHEEKQIPGGNDRKKGKGNGNRRSRFPEGMTERKAKATTGAKAKAKEEADWWGDGRGGTVGVVVARVVVTDEMIG